MPWDRGWEWLWGVAEYLQGYDLRAKQSTRYLAEGAGVLSCATDISQYGTDLSAAASYLFEATTTRFNWGHPRTIGFALTADNTDTGGLYRHGSGASVDSIAFSAANTIRIVVNGAIVVTQTMTVLTGTSDELVLAWVSEANPDTTGASDAVRSYLQLWNVTAGTHERYEYLHAAKTLQAGATAVWGADTHPAGTPFSGTINRIWYENRAQSATEIAFDHIQAGIGAVSETDTEDEHQGVPVSTSTLETEGNYHGPSALWAADATRRMYRRLQSPLWNERFSCETSYDSLSLTGSGFRGAVGDPNYRMSIGWLRIYPVPPTANRLWVRVHTVSTVTSGAAVPIGLRMYSLSQLPGAGGLVGPGGPAPVEVYYVETLVERNDLGSGEWSVFADYLPIARGVGGIRDGLTYLALAIQVDPYAVSTNDLAADIVINAVNVVPCYRATQGSPGFGAGGFADD